MLALFASAAQAETVMVDPGPASIPHEDGVQGELKFAQDFIIDNQTDTDLVEVLFTDDKMLLWDAGSGGRQTIKLYGPDGCGDVQIVIVSRDGDVAVRTQ
jgi:hypothetical protein